MKKKKLAPLAPDSFLQGHLLVADPAPLSFKTRGGGGAGGCRIQGPGPAAPPGSGVHKGEKKTGNLNINQHMVALTLPPQKRTNKKGGGQLGRIKQSTLGGAKIGQKLGLCQ